MVLCKNNRIINFNTLNLDYAKAKFDNNLLTLTFLLNFSATKPLYLPPFP